MPALGDPPPPCPMLMKAGHAHPQHPALHTNRPDPPMAFNKGVSHFWPFANYAVAFPRMSRSIFTRASSARRRLISICSAVTLPCRRPLSAARPDAPPRRFRQALARFHHPHRFLLELQRVSALVSRSSSSFPFRYYISSLRDTFCGSKLNQRLAGTVGLAGSADCRCHRNLWGEPAAERAHSQNGAGEGTVGSSVNRIGVDVCLPGRLLLAVG